ncbi:hypothetical protein FISHEDRAFT_73531 [Fistulina hepatica ATCC 64428]|uniref:ATPase inhibitor, mitochondrial n=1 Tax=Fistulina hepatica ATCC 64428 TaxID=1128425 RepID=A0A0D7ACH5_9AGAR|nr:hypothetical protein FISHEDRAFT_73531 [Fistulina hepatica ATCC 64428]
MLSRLSVARRVPQSLAFARSYTTSGSDGSVAQDHAWKGKERAAEDQFARRHEVELLEKMRREILKKRDELTKLEQKHAEEAAKVEKK